MAIFVADASVVLAWCFEDETSSWSDEVLRRLRQGDQVIVPAHWPTEVLNGLLVGVRKKRLKSGQPVLFWEMLARLPIKAESPLSATEAKAVLSLGEKHVLPFMTPRT